MFSASSSSSKKDSNEQTLEHIASMIPECDHKVELIYYFMDQVTSSKYKEEKKSLREMVMDMQAVRKNIVFLFSYGPMLKVPADWMGDVKRLGCTAQWAAFSDDEKNEKLNIVVVALTTNSKEDLIGKEEQKGVLKLKGNNAIDAAIIDGTLKNLLKIPTFTMEGREFPEVRGSIVFTYTGRCQVFSLTGPVTKEKMDAHLNQINDFVSAKIEDEFDSPSP